MKSLSEKHNDRYEDIVTFINALEKTAQHWFDEGRSLTSRRKYEEALIAYEQAIRLDPNDGIVYNHKGAVLYKLQRYEEAFSTIEQAVRLDPNDALAYSCKGAALYCLQDYVGMLVAFEQAIRLDPYNGSAYYGKGTALNNLGKSRESERAYEMARQLGNIG